MTNSTPTSRTDSDGTISWSLNGELHRIDRPAVEDTNGRKEWWVNSTKHRTDGPAIEWPNGSKGWWVNGEEISTPYIYVLTAAVARGLPIPPGVLPDMLKAMSQATGEQDDQLNKLNSILHHYWPTDVKKRLTTLFMDTEATIKHLAFSLLGREVLLQTPEYLKISQSR